jgi:hypothetical protein
MRSRGPVLHRDGRRAVAARVLPSVSDGDVPGRLPHLSISSLPDVEKLDIASAFNLVYSLL